MSTADAEVRRSRAMAWLPASFAVVALVGAALPWFAPTGTGRSGRLHIPEAHCWQAGRIGFLAPLLLVLTALSIVGPRVGWFGRNQPPRRLGRDGWFLAGAGVVAGIVLLLTWLLLPKSYTFSGLTWDNVAAAGFDMQRGPQPGYFLTIAAAGDAVVCGVVYLFAARREASDRSEVTAGIIDSHDGEDPGR
ncbi:MAG TPA: hypothetical protein VGH43_13910 [Jatrophihabitans sp.]|jgi:hypothetical protein